MRDIARVARAVATNQLARFAPSAYVRLTAQTGRGESASESAAEIATYFRDSLDAYLDELRVARTEANDFLAGKTVMEYGPGDLPGVAALMVARGAEKVYCVDRFPLLNVDDKNERALQALIGSCQGIERRRFLSCFKDVNNLRAGFNPDRIEYLVAPNGLSCLHHAVDLVISRAVLEHVNDLGATFDDMVRAMRPGAKAIHLVDLRSHGLHKKNPLDFLEWPRWLWSAMYSAKGVPNRWRVNEYRDTVQKLPVRMVALRSTTIARAEDLTEVRPRLAREFRAISHDDLAWLGFWLVLEKVGE